MGRPSSNLRFSRDMTSTWLVVVLVVAFANASPPKFVTSEEPTYDDSTEPPTTDSELLADQTDDYDDDDPSDYDTEYDEEDLQSDYLSEDIQSRPGHKPPKRIDHINKDKPVNLAKKHFDRVKALYSCHTPQPKVIKVLEHHPSSSKTYLPHCTILHHCSESTGCCPTFQRCGPKRSEKLELPFYVLHQVPGLDPRRTTTHVKIETLVFYNHTECGCHERGDEMPRDVTPTPDQPETPLNPYTECKCPAPFNPRLESGYCTCDCFDKQHGCIKYKRGRDYLNHQDRLCIEMRKCKLPACDYGVYMRRFGRCPRKDEKFRFQ